MTNNYVNFESLEDRGKYTRRLRELFENNNLNSWGVCSSIKTDEIFIRPLGGKLENEREISRISIQINKNDKISFGLSGYNYRTGEYIKKICGDRGYEYNIHMQKSKEDAKEEVKDEKKEAKDEEEGEPGRWWLTKPLDNLESVVNAFKDIEPILM